MGVNQVKFGTDILLDVSGVTVTEDALVQGVSAVNAQGEPIIGNNPYEKAKTDNEVANQSELIGQIKAVLESKAAGGGMK